MNKIRTLMLAAVSVVCTTMVAQKSITEQIYWIDGDVGNAQTVTRSIDISTLSTGLHSFTIRVQDSEDLWSSPLTKYFIIPQNATAATSIAEREYWIDGNIATRAALGVSPADISLVDLSVGIHSLTIRVKDNAGIWSTPLTKYFVVPQIQEETTIARYMYWIDDDEANPATGTVTEASGVMDIDIGELTEGEHTLSWRMADSKGAWSDVATQTFTFTRSAITGEMIALAQSSYEYAAEEIKPEVTVTDGDKTLTAGEDYEVSYANNTNAGDATITVTGKGAYKESGDAQFTITKATLTATADDKTREYGDDNPELTFVYSGWKGTDNESVLTTVPTANTEATSASNVGEYVITVSGGEATNYNFDYTAGKLTITKAMLTVTADDKEMKKGEEVPELTIVYSGWKGTDDENVLTTPPTANTEATTASEPGEYVITVSGGEATNYDFTYVDGKLTITVATDIGIIQGGKFTKPVDVYDLSGKKVATNETSLTQLPNGAYIIEGKKVTVKR